MSIFLRYLVFLSLATWVGSVIYLSFVVAPGAFATMASRDLAGAVVGMALTRLHLLGLAAGVVFLLARLGLMRSAAALLAPAALAVILMLVLTVISQYWVTPHMVMLRLEMGSVDRTPVDSLLRIQFDRLHRASVGLETGVLLAGLAALFLTVHEKRI